MSTRDRRANGDVDLELLAMAPSATLVQQGRTEEGMSLLDEAMAGAIGGEGRSKTVAQTNCMTMVVGSSFDLERATQWIQALDRFIDRYGCPFLYAECRTYYGRVLFENGDWNAAEVLLADAISMSKDVFPATHAFASGTLAELRLAQGRIEDAEREYCMVSTVVMKPPRRSPRCTWPRENLHWRPRCFAGGSAWRSRTGSTSRR
jgi:hypothetical protein